MGSGRRGGRQAERIGSVWRSRSSFVAGGL